MGRWLNSMIGKTSGAAPSRRWLWRGAAIALLSATLVLATVGAVNAAPFGPFAAHPHLPPTTIVPLGGMHEWTQNGAWFQRMIYLYASGMPPVQQAALSAGAQAQLTSRQVATISQAVRATWVSLMRTDPATLGRVGAHPNFMGQWRALTGLRATLAHIAGARANAFYTATDRVYAQVSQYSWLIAHLPRHANSVTKNFGDYALVYATAFSIPSTPTNEQYVALPDVYLKYANLGEGAQIPAPYQNFYQVGANYTVDVFSAYGVGEATHIPILDDGPWNEDDNWWDQMNPSATLASGCPLATSTLSGATTNAQVDGICPGGRDWRRVAYYLLYQHGGLPFFQKTSYKPSGSFSNGTNWPTTLAQNCPESALASINNDAAPCGNTGYNNHNGAWLRDGTVQSPILNQAGIDLSPATDASLGWVWPSSGFVDVNVGNLP